MIKYNLNYSLFTQKVIEVRSLSQIIGEDDLTEIDKIYMKFGRQFEQNFLNQNFDEARTIEESLDIAWDLFKLSLNRVR